MAYRIRFAVVAADAPAGAGIRWREAAVDGLADVLRLSPAASATIIGHHGGMQTVLGDEEQLMQYTPVRCKNPMEGTQGFAPNNGRWQDGMEPSK